MGDDGTGGKRRPQTRAERIRELDIRVLARMAQLDDMRKCRWRCCVFVDRPVLPWVFTS